MRTSPLRPSLVASAVSTASAEPLTSGLSASTAGPGVTAALTKRALTPQWSGESGHTRGPVRRTDAPD